MTQTETGRARSFRVALPTCGSGIGLGTGVLTADGELPVEYLIPGDRVLTHDAGLQPLAQIVTRTVAASEIVRLRPRVLDPTTGRRDLLISARQRLLIRDWRARAVFGQKAVLVEAARLVDGSYMARLDGAAPMRLYQLVFARSQHLVYLGESQLLATSARRPGKVRA